MSFFTSLTGLNAAQTELATVSNNIANTGTNGFKRSRVAFGDIIASSPLQNPARVIGSGVAVKSVAQQFQQGAIETSDNALDLAISGQGFFTVKGGQGGSQVAFTRNGAFSVTADRYVVDASGRRLQLFPTTSDGSVLTNQLASTISARLPLTSGVPQATSEIRLAVNLPSDAVVIPAKPIYTAANPYAFDRNDPSTFNNSTSETVYDSLGNPLAATIYYVKTAVPTVADPFHHWTAHVFVGDTELTQAGVAGLPMDFDTNGVLTAPTTPAVFDAFTPPGGGQPQVIALDHGIATTQQSGAFSVATISQDGFQTGQLESVSVDVSGKHFIHLLTDSIRLLVVSTGGVSANAVEEVIDMAIETHHADAYKPVERLTTLSDALPALGIVAAVLGVVKTMGSIDKPPSVLGGMIGSALVGTFLGVLLSYGIVGPCAARLKAVLDADGEIYQVVRRVIVASLKGQPQPLVIEAARTAIAPANQPSFSEVFDGMRAK